MKALIVLFVALLSLAACNNSNEVESTVDSIEKRADTLMKNIDSTADATIDSVKNWGERQAEKVDSAAKARKDSVQSN